MTAPASGTVCAKVKLRIAGAGRHVDDETIEFAPGDIAQHLLDRGHDHRPAPDHRLFLVDQEADRHGLDAIGLRAA